MQKEERNNMPILTDAKRELRMDFYQLYFDAKVVYPAHRWAQAVDNRDPLEYLCEKMQGNAADADDGFMTLHMAGRHDLTVEWLIVNPENHKRRWWSIIPDEVREFACKRLEIYGYGKYSYLSA
jgi:hypothetical protein